jgi:hypothetical protein
MSGDAYPGRYLSLMGLFDNDSTTVFVDNHAHVTEVANRRIAARIADELAPLLRGAATPSTQR